MGAVISIKTDMPCPNCHEPMEWQSKSLTYDGFYLGVAQTIPLSERVDGEMHGLCDGCGKWFDVELARGKAIGVRQSEPLSLPLLSTGS
jgi:hypothetical protein